MQAEPKHTSIATMTTELPTTSFRRPSMCELAEARLESVDEISFISSMMFSYLARNAADPSQKVLLCGSWEDLEPCLVSLTMATGNRSDILSRVIVATNDVRLFINRYFKSSKLNIVDWHEAAYEEILIERVKPPRDDVAIVLAIDFTPTLRRLGRIRQLLDKDGMLIITAETPGWRIARPELMSSFSAHGGMLVKLTECLPAAAKVDRQVSLLRQGRRTAHIRGAVGFADALCLSGEKSR